MEVKHIGKYLLGAAAGIVFVVSCGSNDSITVPSSKAAVVTDQMFCYAGSVYAIVKGAAFMGQVPFTCQSKGSAQIQTFDDFNAVTKAGWVLTIISSTGGKEAYIFQK